MATLERDPAGSTALVPTATSTTLAPVPPALIASNRYEPAIRAAVAALDLEDLARQFRAQDQFIYIERFLPPALVAEMVREARSLERRQHRAYVPFFRKAGTVGQIAISAEAPALAALHWSPSFLEFVGRLAEVQLSFKNPRDDHAAALYLYQKSGDHVSWHYDDCGCEATLSYTATLALVNDTHKSRAHFRLFRKDRTRPAQDLLLSTVPGSLVLFCGTKAYHRVTALGRNEERITFSLAYVREGRTLTGFSRFRENIKDAILYFGPRALFQKNY